MSPTDLERLAGWAPEGMSRMRGLKGEEAQRRLMSGVGKGWTPLLYAAVVYEEADTRLMSDAHDTTYKVDKYVTKDHIGAVLRLRLDKELFLALRSVQAFGPLTMADCARALERITLIDRALKMGAFESAGGLCTLFRELTPGISNERRGAGDPELAGLLVDHVAKHGRKAAAARNRGVGFESTLGDIDRSTRQQLGAFTPTWAVYLDAVERSAAARRTAGVKDTDPLGGKRKAWEDDKDVDKGVHGDKNKPG